MHGYIKGGLIGLWKEYGGGFLGETNLIPGGKVLLNKDNPAIKL